MPKYPKEKKRNNFIIVHFVGRGKPLEIVLLPPPTHTVTIHLEEDPFKENNQNLVFAKIDP